MKIKKTVATTTKKNASPVRAKATQPKPGVAAQAQAKAESESKAPRQGINAGQKTGIRVMLFQDMTLATNDQPKRPAPLAHIPGQLTDTELAKVWRDEFPNSRAVLAGRIDEAIVRGVRNLYNAGTSGHGTPGVKHESKPWVIGEGGKRVQAAYTRVRKVGEPKADAAPASKTRVSAEQAEAQTKASARKAVKVVVAAKGAKASKVAQRKAA